MTKKTKTEQNDFRRAIGEKFSRSFELKREAVNAEARTVELSFSSEAPVRRWFGDEILGHDVGECDLSRLNSGAALLLNHCTEDQPGVVDKAWIDPTDKKGRAIVRFSKCEDADEIFQDVVDGIRRLVSVGYSVDEIQMVKSADGGQSETYRVTRWTPYEISLVAVPADVSVGVGRSQTDKTNSNQFEKSMSQTAAPEVTKPTAPAASDNADVLKAERSRVTEITALGERFNKSKEASKAIADGVSVADFRSALLDGIRVEVVNQPTVTVSTPAVAAHADNRSAGELFVSSDAYKKFVSSTGNRSASFEIPGFSMTRTTLASTGLTSIEKRPGVPGILDQQPIRVANIIASGSTGSSTIRYIQEDSFTNSAAAVAEGSAKAESALAVSEVDATVRKIATYLKVTDEMVSDFDQMKSFVDARLAYMIGDKVDYYLLNGSGSSNQIKGLLNFSGISTQAVGGDLVQDAIYKAITKVRNTAGFIEPDAIVIHPSDYQNLRLSKDSNGQYYAGGPWTGSYGNNGLISNNAPIWGLPAIVTTNIAQGTALVGAFKMGAQWFQKLGLTVETTNTDQDDFIKNLVTVRAEIRLALACYKPKAFCSVTGIA